MKYYFEYLDSENCFTKEHFIELMEGRCISELKVYLAKIMYGSGYFYCQKYGETGESSEGTCGKWCESYKPRNGKNGRCKYHSNPYEASDKPITIKL